MGLIMDLLARSNDALKANPVTGVDEALAAHGSDWLWAVMAIYIMALFGCLVMSFTGKEAERVFHYLFIFILLVGAITYFAQAADLGWSPVVQTDKLGNGTIRQIFWVKYINWVVAWPSLALCLGLISGGSWTTIICNIAIALQWPVCYLVGAFVTTSYKWGFFAFGTFGWLILAMSTINESRESAQLLGVDNDYIVLSVWRNLLWSLYPIAWSLSDGGNVIGITGASVFFGILDVLMVPGLAFIVLFLSRKWDYRHLSIAFSDSRPSREMEAAAAFKPENSGSNA